MQIFVANASLQRVLFFYRDPVDKLLKNIVIERGRQISLPPRGKTWQPSDCSKVIRQIEDAGGHDAAEAHAHIEKFDGLLYRIDAPISPDEIVMANQEVKKMQRERSVEQAVRGVLGMDRAANPDKGQRRARSVEVEVQEIVPPGKHATGDEVNFSLSVDPDRGTSDPKGVPGLIH